VESLTGKTALITGASKRLGREIALTLAAEGVGTVLHHNRSVREADELREEISAQGVPAWTLAGDLSDPETAEGLIARAVEIAGPLDILVNNASVFDPGNLEQVAFEDVRLNVAINAWAPFVLSRSFAAQKREGVIINLLDSRLRGYDFAHVAYILSKHLLEVLTRMTALEWAPRVRVNAVAPGLVLPPPGRDNSYLEALSSSLPLKRHGKARDVAEAVLFLVRSEFITGQVIYVDGGRHLLEGRA
jgi:NAD(P)-dependent dehydrogenase (short-subunit alcohol dehydrogenase family)